jgi:hypothetical protein
MQPGIASTAAGDPAHTRVRIPHHVVYRSYVAETVVLNLETGEYLGLGQTVGRLLEALEGSRTVADAAKRVADECGRPADQVERMCLELCARLAERGLVQISPLDA